jgi:hypothetical protein
LRATIGNLLRLALLAGGVLHLARSDWPLGWHELVAGGPATARMLLFFALVGATSAPARWIDGLLFTEGASARAVAPLASIMLRAPRGRQALGGGSFLVLVVAALWARRPEAAGLWAGTIAVVCAGVAATIFVPPVALVLGPSRTVGPILDGTCAALVRERVVCLLEPGWTRSQAFDDGHLISLRSDDEQWRPIVRSLLPYMHLVVLDLRGASPHVLEEASWVLGSARTAAHAVFVNDDDGRLPPLPGPPPRFAPAGLVRAEHLVPALGLALAAIERARWAGGRRSTSGE